MNVFNSFSDDELLSYFSDFYKEDQLRLEEEQEELYQESKERMFYELEESLS